MATNEELLNQAMGRLGTRASPVLRAHVLNEINTAIDNLERGTFFPWFLEKTASLSVVVDDTFVSLPADFAIEADESRPYYVQGGGNFYLTKRFHAALQGEVPTSLKFYAIHGTEFHFRHVADKAYTIFLPYYGRQTGNLVDDATTVSNLWLINAKDWVLGMALKVVASVYIQNDALSLKHAGAENQGKQTLYVHHEARININQDFVVGGASDGT